MLMKDVPHHRNDHHFKFTESHSHASAYIITDVHDLMLKGIGCTGTEGFSLMLGQFSNPFFSFSLFKAITSPVVLYKVAEC
jgi:hypothetical protein